MQVAARSHLRFGQACHVILFPRTIFLSRDICLKSVHCHGDLIICCSNYASRKVNAASVVPCAVVFKMHYSELLARDQEVAKLKAVIQGLSGK